MQQLISGRSMAPKLSRFGNPVSGSILFTIILMVVVGLILITLIGSGWGIPLVVIGVGAYFLGETQLKEKPVTAGVLYFWGRPIRDSNGQAYVVGGTTLKFDIWPIYLNLLEIDMTSKEKKYTFEVTSGNGVNLKATIILVCTPNQTDLIDLIQVGGTLEEALIKIEGTLGLGLQRLVGSENDEELTKKGEKIRVIGEELKALVEGGSFGIVVNKLSLDFDQPDEIKEAMQSSRVEEYQQQAEDKDLSTALALAQRMLQSFKASDPNSKVTLEQCFDKTIGMLRASRSGNVTAFAQQGGRGKRNRGGVPVVAVVNQQQKP